MITTPSNAGSPSLRPDLTVDVPRQTSFHVEVGKYTGSIRSVSIQHRQTIRESIPAVRFLLNVTVPGANIDYLAKIDFRLDLNEGSELWNVLCRLIGRKRLQECSGGKFDLYSLVGTPCDIEIDHVRDRAEAYEFPLVIVTDLQPAGTFVESEAEEDDSRLVTQEKPTTLAPTIKN